MLEKTAVAGHDPVDYDGDIEKLLPAISDLAHRNLFLRLFQGSAVQANEATSLKEAVSSVLDYVCTELGWPVGHVYLADATGTLRSSSVWYLPQEDRYEEFRIATAAVQVEPDVGLPGMVLATGKPAWSVDTSDEPACAARNATVTPALVSGFAFPIKANGRTVAIIEMLTHERLEADEELLHLMGQVAAQVSLVADRFHAHDVLAAFATELGRSNRALEEFASIASHDLQEPLRKVQSFGDRLQTLHGHLLPEDGQMYLARMIESTARMQTLINDLLVYSRVTPNAKLLAPVNLEDIIAQVVSQLGDQISRTGGHIEVDALPVVYADPIQMNQLFQNLLSNALKFHRPGVPPIVRITATERRTEPPNGASTTDERDDWIITLSDNGIGFTDKHANRIFQMFARLHGRGVYEGTGIGLAICRKIVEHHGGSISATGVPDEGCTFTITLPK